jgi:hypothetical protein
MNSEQLTASKRDALAAWNTDATRDGYDSPIPSHLRDSLGEWEANYLLPQLLLGAEYPARTPELLMPGWLQRLLSGWRAP